MQNRDLRRSFISEKISARDRGPSNVSYLYHLGGPSSTIAHLDLNGSDSQSKERPSCDDLSAILLQQNGRFASSPGQLPDVERRDECIQV